MWLIHLLLLGVSPCIVLANWTDCSAACICKWRGGKTTALCANADLTTIPDSLPAVIQVLDLSGNKITNLTNDVFLRAGLPNLQRIILKGSGVRDLHREAFRRLDLLVEADLSENFISALHKDTFAGNEELRALYLNRNPLTELHAAQFPQLLSLKKLAMHHCLIATIHNDAFINLPSLEVLSLNGNLLKQISDKVFLPLTKLDSLSLDGNPWKCDCELRGFRNWLVSSYVYTNSTSCNEPSSLASQQWKDILPEAFSCPPSVHVADSTIQEEPGENVAIKCRVSGDPKPDVTWLFKGKILGNSSQDHLVEEVDGDVKTEKWSSLSVMNVTEEDAGEYTCLAKNVGGQAAINVTLILSEVLTTTTVAKSEP